jgi:hypothetical protein
MDNLPFAIWVKIGSSLIFWLSTIGNSLFTIAEKCVPEPIIIKQFANWVSFCDHLLYFVLYYFSGYQIMRYQ